VRRTGSKSCISRVEERETEERRARERKRKIEEERNREREREREQEQEREGERERMRGRWGKGGREMGGMQSLISMERARAVCSIDLACSLGCLLYFWAVADTSCTITQELIQCLLVHGDTNRVL
jgi:hypothetical protein